MPLGAIRRFCRKHLLAPLRAVTSGASTLAETALKVHVDYHRAAADALESQHCQRVLRVKFSVNYLLLLLTLLGAADIYRGLFCQESFRINGWLKRSVSRGHSSALASIQKPEVLLVQPRGEVCATLAKMLVPFNLS